jgi:hypothetical protein
MTSPASRRLPEELERGIEDARQTERARVLGMTNMVRAVGVGAWLLTSVLVGYLGEARVTWRVQVVPLAIYFVLSLVVIAIGRTKMGGRTWLAIAALDTPAATLVVSTSLPFTHEPHAVADMHLGVCILVILIAVSALSTRAVIATSIVALAAEEWLMQRTDEGIGERVVAAVAIGLAGVLATFTSRRIISLVRRAARRSTRGCRRP